MKVKAIRNTDLLPSVICLGTSHIGSSISEDDSNGILDAYTDAGGNFLDTAEVYANWLPIEPSSSERFLGKWMKDRGNRDQMIVATKGGHPRLDTPMISRLSAEEIGHDILGSLQRLGTDYIDLYYLHRDDLRIPVEILIEIMETHVRQGHIRYYACSNWTLERLEQAQLYAASKGYAGFVAVSNLWSLATVNPGSIKDPSQVVTDQALIDWHTRTGTALIPYSSQANGFFSGKYRREYDVPPEGRSNIYKLYHNETNFTRLERTEELARLHKATTNQIALAYLLAQSFPVFPVVGCKNQHHLQDSLGAVDVELDPVIASNLSS
ncbi:Predicted oxidoreductase [Paenibacillus sp. 1_12]|uniref:aldo/keto reductase n=1 Tax=Paenibacillus sp. 1_12 TaxID=1566278 RepID=UPI0008E42C6D|nr:aldo/keto reductase [Paenibacillus sp. 1_12]SFL68031.1 Predicted oxidoreductase [Paenibacillus sp. 1_12]